MKGSIRVGHGFDVHRLVEGRELWLCGICVPYDKGLLGHSDADVAIHALCDAILGSLALGDIGKHFPDTDQAYKGTDSKLLLAEVVKMIHERGYRLGNADITIMAERPKLRPYIDDMRECLASICKVDVEDISVKATTTEGLGFTGRGEGISAQAGVLIFK